MITINKNLTTAKLFIGTDKYYHTVDNRPLWEILKNIAAIADTVNEIAAISWDVFSVTIESPSVETNVGGRYKFLLNLDGSSGLVYAVSLSNGTAGSSGSTVVDVNINGTTCFTEQANRPVLAFNDADGVVVVENAQIENDVLEVGDVVTVDIDTLQAGTPRFVRVDVYVLKIVKSRPADDYAITGNPLEVTYAG